jgi:prepilin-type N-terminal cleavage/methylation domain-containing protein
MPRISRHRLAIWDVQRVRAFRAFTLTELIAVIAIIAVIVGILIPAVSKVRKSAAVTKDLAQVRNLQLAHQAYMADNEYRFVDMNILHTPDALPNQPAWLTLLQKHYVTPLSLRSPLDLSPHWPTDQDGQGIALPTAVPGGYQFRRTSYGCNGFLSPQGISSEQFAVTGDTAFIYDRMTKVKNPAATVDFVLMAEEGDFAGSDHVHPEEWDDAEVEHAPELAADQMHTSAAGGKPRSGDARSNYGFLDGRAETLRFADVYIDAAHNRFDPSKVAAHLQLRSVGAP